MAIKKKKAKKTPLSGKNTLIPSAHTHDTSRRPPIQSPIGTGAPFGALVSRVKSYFNLGKIAEA